MAEKLAERGIQFTVLYMNENEPDRSWPLLLEDMKHDYKIFSKNRVVKKLGMWMHFCPKLQSYLVSQKYDVAILGGLASPAHFMASLLLPRSSMNILSVESNMASIGNQGNFATRVKSYLMRRFYYFQVTGGRSVSFIEHYLPKKRNKEVITLPNVINEPLFSAASTSDLISSISSLLGQIKNNQKLVALIPARLIEDKGLFPFLESMPEDLNLHILIAGEGPLRDSLEQYVEKNRLNVSFIGSQPPAQIASLMKAVDYLILPSKADPSPLSVIEAAYCSLPIVISKNVGNLDEVLIEGQNGWSFEFGNKSETKLALEKAASVSSSALAKMRDSARQVFEQKFEANNVINNYISTLLEKSMDRAGE